MHIFIHINNDAPHCVALINKILLNILAKISLKLQYFHKAIAHLNQQWFLDAVILFTHREMVPAIFFIMSKTEKLQ